MIDCQEGYGNVGPQRARTLARKLLEINKKAVEKNLKVGVGLMCRHCKSRNELKKRIDDGAIGDITFLRSYRLQGAIGSCFISAAG